MNDEIKEILESLDKIAKSEYYPEDLLYYENCKILLDYITNLQEEIERQSKAQVILDDMLADYKYRIDKAIEHIEEIWKSAEGGNIYVITIVGLIRTDLLNILQNGSDDNE